MSKRYFVYSTLSCDQAYTNYAEGGADLPLAMQPVHIKGGAGIANDRIITPRGVCTEVTEEQLEYLKQNQVFRLHEQNGFILVSEHDTNPDKAAADMESRDGSAPVVPQELSADDQPMAHDEVTKHKGGRKG